MSLYEHPRLRRSSTSGSALRSAFAKRHLAAWWLRAVYRAVQTMGGFLGGRSTGQVIVTGTAPLWQVVSLLSPIEAVNLW